jgi:hypothetical protein
MINFNIIFGDIFYLMYLCSIYLKDVSTNYIIKR